MRRASLQNMMPTPAVSTSIDQKKAQIAQEQAEAAQVTQTPASQKREKPFTQEQLADTCAKLGAELKAKSELTIGAMVEKADVDGQMVRLSSTNPTVRNKFETIKTDILSAIRDRLQNDNIELHFELETEESPAKKGFTAEERYREIVAKYPLVEKLRQMLDLYIDY